MTYRVDTLSTETQEWVKLCEGITSEDDAIHTAMVASKVEALARVTCIRHVDTQMHTWCVGWYSYGELVPHTSGFTVKTHDY